MAVLAKPVNQVIELDPKKANEFFEKSKNSQSLKKLLERAEKHAKHEKQK